MLYIAGCASFDPAGMLTPSRIILTALVLALPALLLPASAENQAPAPQGRDHVPAGVSHAAPPPPSTDDGSFSDINAQDGLLSSRFLDLDRASSSLSSGYFSSEAEQ